MDANRRQVLALAGHSAVVAVASLFTTGCWGWRRRDRREEIEERSDDRQEERD